MTGKMRRAWLCIVVAGFVPLGGAHGQQAVPIRPPLPFHVLRALHANPQIWRDFLDHRARLKPAASPARTAPAGKLTWIAAFSNLPLSNPILLTDGSVIAHEVCRGNWYRADAE